METDIGKTDSLPPINQFYNPPHSLLPQLHKANGSFDLANNGIPLKFRDETIKYFTTSAYTYSIAQISQSDVFD